MHNQFNNKRRRKLNLREMQVESVLPEHFAEYYPKFIALLERYYEFQEGETGTELLHHLFAARDINETDIELLTYIEDELLLGEAYFKGFGSNDTELRAAANFSNILFRSKGTKFAIEWFFRSFYGEDVEVLYPKENIFIVGDVESRIGADSLRYLTDDKLYQTFALLVRVGISISRWKDVFKLFTHPAGMYLGGEVFLVDEVEANIVTVNDVIEQYTTPTYSFGGPFTVAEGTPLAMYVQGTNVRNGGTDAVYWYGEHLTTSDSDFSALTPLYDSNNKQYLEINNSENYIILIPNIDAETDPLEGNESFKLYLEDKSGRILDEATILIGDVVPSWSITANPSFNINEGQTTSITFTSTNAEYYGDTKLYWYFDSTASTGSPTAAFDSDFTQVLPNRWNPSEIDISTTLTTNEVNGIEIVTSALTTGSIDLTPRVDGWTEGTETFVFRLRNSEGVDIDSFELNVGNVAPALAVSAANIVEGEDIVATITCDPDDVGKILDWTLTSDSRISATSGQIELTSTSTVLTVPTTANDTYQGPTTITITVTDDALPLTVNDTFDITDEAAVYVLEIDPSVGNEGDGVTYSVSGTNIPDGSVYLYIANAPPTPTSDADWTTTPPRDGSRQEIVISGGTGSFSLTYATNGDTDTEYYEAYIYDAATGGTELASAFGSILGTSVVASTVVPDKTTVIEDGTLAQRTVTFTFTAGTNEADGTYNYYVQQVSGNLTSFDFTSGFATSTSRGSFTVTSGTGSFDLVVREDYIRDIADQFRVVVGNSSLVTVATSSTVSIGTESVPEYTVNAYDGLAGAATVTTITEEANLYIGVDPVNTNQNETLYIELSGDGASQYSESQATISVSSATGLVIYAFPTLGDNGINEADRTVTATVTLGDYASGSPTLTIGSVSVTIEDPAVLAPTFTLTADNTTPNEGDLITFTVSGTNITNGTYYYRPAGFVPVTATSVTSGSTFIPMSSTAGLNLGMSAQANLGINGTIVSIGSGGVTMSQAASQSSPNPVVLTFAPDSQWGWFSPTSEAFGSVSVSSNNGTFTVQTVEEPSTDNGGYTWILYDAELSTTSLASEVVTIQNITTLPYTLTNEIPDNSVEFFVALRGRARASLEFRSNGEIWADDPTQPNQGAFTKVGDWITGTFDPAEFEAYVTITIAEDGDYETVSGSYDTPLTLDQDRLWYIETVFTEGPPGSTTSATMTVTATITGPTGTSISNSVFFSASISIESI
jgi:hypothetical protein